MKASNVKTLTEIRDKINERRMPGSIIQELAGKLEDMLLLDKPIAVRSSAIAEDSGVAFSCDPITGSCDSAHLQAADYRVPSGMNWVRLYKGRGS